MKKRLVGIVCMLIITITAFVGCGDSGGPSSGEGTSTGNWQGKLNIMMFDGGYGLDWIKSIAAEYKKINPRVTINIKSTAAPAGEIATIEAGTAGHDIYFMIDIMQNLVARNKLADLTDVYEYAEEGGEKLIDRMNPAYVEAFRNEGDKFYMMPWSNSQEGLVYNKTTVDKYFPDGLQMPRTSDELLEVGDIIKAKSDKLVTFCYSGKNDYLPYFFIPWWAQYQGYNEYMDYYSGMQPTTDGGKEFCKNGEVGLQEGRKQSWLALEKLVKKSNGYTHPRTDAMDFQQSALLFLGHGFNEDGRESVFSVNGEWLINETSFALEAKPQDIRFLKTPVLSAVIDKLSTVNDDATLREVVDFVDGVKQTAPSGVSEEDIAYVREARKMVNSVAQDHNLAVYSGSKSIPLAKNFLKFMTTKKAGEIYSRKLSGMTLPYGAFDPLVDATDIEMHGYIRSKNEVYKDFIPVYQDRDPILVYRGGLAAFREKQGVKLFDGTKSAMDYFDENARYNRENWRNMCTAAGLANLLG